jgi:hypothetical protein
MSQLFFTLREVTRTHTNHCDVRTQTCSQQSCRLGQGLLSPFICLQAVLDFTARSVLLSHASSACKRPLEAADLS